MQLHDLNSLFFHCDDHYSCSQSTPTCSIFSYYVNCRSNSTSLSFISLMILPDCNFLIRYGVNWVRFGSNSSRSILKLIFHEVAHYGRPWITINLNHPIYVVHLTHHPTTWFNLFASSSSSFYHSPLPTFYQHQFQVAQTLNLMR